MQRPLRETRLCLFFGRGKTSKAACFTGNRSQVLMKSELLCINCGHQMIDHTLPKYVVNTYALQPVVCLNVPVEKCPNCGEIYFPAEVAEMFEKIRSEQMEPPDKITMEIPACSLDLAVAG
jgi:YgiT-type zinc finger domain-containing protein